MTTPPNDEGLRRVVGVGGLAANIVNLSVGSGIYALPALIAVHLGSAAVIGFLFCGIMFAAIVLCYVEIGSRIKKSGGSYAYVEAAFGHFPGFVVNWLFFFGWGAISDAAVINIAVDSLTLLFPVLSPWYLRVFILFLLIGLMLLVNIRDTKFGVRVIEIITAVKLLPLIAIILFGLSRLQPANLRIDHFPPWNAFNDSAVILFFSLAGFESSLNASGEIKNPKRTVPLALFWGGIITFLFYVIIQLIAQGVLGPAITQYKNAPLAAVAEKIAGPVAASGLLIAATISCFGTVMGDLLASPRLLFAGARDGLFPKFLAKVHPRFATPHWAVTTYALLIFIFSVSGGFKQLAVLASGALLLIYLAVVASLIKLRFAKTANDDDSFQIPGGLLVPSVAIIAILYVLSNLSRTELISIIVFVAIITAIYFVMKYINNKSFPRSVTGHTPGSQGHE